MAVSEPDRLKVAILASHDGTNAHALMDACQTGAVRGKVALVISNNSRSGVLERAQAEGATTRHLSSRTHPAPEALDEAIRLELCDHGVSLVVLAGYLRKLGAATLHAFNGRIINIHPALLPKYGGQGMYGRRVHEAVLAANEAVSGVSIHLVDEQYDHGPVIAQREVPVQPGDDPDTLAARILPVEHELLVDTVARIARGELPAGT